jgi:hypothetical protein
MKYEVFGFVDAQEQAKQSGIQKIELRGFDKPFSEIFIMRSEQDNEKTAPAELITSVWLWYG